MITQDMVKDLLIYESGRLMWRKSGTGRKVAAGSVTSLGYCHIEIKINNKRCIFKRHQLVFLYHHGYIPECVDHIDRDRSNDKIENLRAVTMSQNSANKKISTGKNPHRGVSFEAQSNTYRVRIGGKHKGRFSNLEDAILESKRAFLETYGFEMPV